MILKRFVILMALCFILVPLISINGMAQGSQTQAIFTGTLRIDGAIVAGDVPVHIQLLNQSMQFIREANYNPVNGTFGVSAYSGDGFNDNDIVLFRVALHTDTILAKTSPNPVKYIGAVVPTPPAPITVNLVNNHPPQFTSTPVDSAKEDSVYHYQLVATDPDNDALTFSIVSAPAWLLIDANGVLTGTPGASDVGVGSVTIQVTDGFFEGTVQQSFSITVHHTNHPPRLSSTPVDTAYVDSVYHYTVTAIDVDHDVLDFSLLIGPTWLHIDSLTGALTGTPRLKNEGDTSVVVRVDDQHGFHVDQAFTLHIVFLDHAPVAVNLALNATDGNPLVVTLQATDADNDSLSFIVLTQPKHGQLSGTAPNLQFLAPVGYHGVDTFTYTANDGRVNGNTARVIITTAHVNHPPGAFVRTLPVDDTHLVDSVRFTWTRAIDVDPGDRVGYFVFLSIGDKDTTLIVADTDFTVNTKIWPLPVNLELQVRWAVTASDGHSFTEASNDTGSFTLTVIGTGVSGKTNGIPKVFSLKQNYPNPFNPTTQVTYDLPQQSEVRITIYDILGHAVKTLAEGSQAAGTYTMQWDATNNFGASVSSGIYIYRIQAVGVNGAAFNQTKKMMLVR